MLLSFVFSNKEIMKVSMALISFVIAWAYLSYKNVGHPKYGLFFKISLYSIFVVSISFFAYTFISNIYPKEWDFTCFYLFGKVAGNGWDFYNPADYYKILNYVEIPFELSDDFRVEVLDVGCLYPPQTLLLFLPFGFMTYMQAMYFFYGLILIAVIGSIIIVKNEFFKESNFNGWVIAIIFLLLTKPLLSTVVYTQTLIFLLLFVLLFYKFRDKRLSGVFLAFAMIIKPFAVVLLVYLLFKKQWRSVLFFMYTMAIITTIAALAFGIQPFIDYFVSHPSSRLPSFFFTETTNQSLLAELYRLLPQNMALAKVINYCVTAFLLILGGVITTSHYKREGDTEFLFGLLLSIMLLIYPNGQVYYPIVHLLSLFIFLRYISGQKLQVLFIVVFYIVLSFGLLYTNILILLVSIGFIYPVALKKLAGKF